MVLVFLKVILVSLIFCLIKPNLKRLKLFIKFDYFRKMQRVFIITLFGLGD